MPSNQHRAGRIELTLMEYHDPDNEAALTDLLTDALHYCHIHAIDFTRAIERAHHHFAFEKQLGKGGDHE